MGPRVGYLFNEVVIGLRRNLLMTLATIVTVTVSLALLGAGLLVQQQVDLARKVLFADIEVSVFLVPDIAPEQRTSLERDLRTNPVVADVIYESREQAYENFQQLFANDPATVEAVTAADLPESFRVKLSDPQQFAVVKSQFVEYPGVDEIIDQRDVLDKFFRLMNALRNGAVGVAVLQLAAAAALISNTIRLTAFARREQTGIMKLVGATNWYIRLPFVLEGIVAGVVGAFLAVGLLLVAMATLVSRVRADIQFVPIIGELQVLRSLPILLLVGAGIAAVASVVALRKFLDV